MIIWGILTTLAMFILKVITVLCVVFSLLIIFTLLVAAGRSERAFEELRQRDDVEGEGENESEELIDG